VERTVRVPSVAGRMAIRGPKRLLALRSDGRLVELARSGDDAAFEVLYERYVAAILGFCRHMLGSQEEAEDAVQQAFVAAHGAIRRGSREIAFKPWVYTIARNRCLSILRARREQPMELPELSTAGLNEQIEQRADLRELVQDVQRLPEQQRAALLLSELDDLSHAEVAEVIGCKPQAVKGLVFRARSALAERRAARAAACDDIRVELASAKGGALRRGRLRYHLESCPACAAYLEELRCQRRLLGVALPVVPTLALKDSVLVEVGIGMGGGAAATGGGGAGLVAAGGAGGAGGAASAGSALVGATAVKVAVAGAILVGGAGVATEVVRETDGGSRDKAPAETRQAPGVTDAPRKQDAGVPQPGTPAARALERRGGARGAERHALGQRRAAERSGGRAAAGGRRGKAPGQGQAKGFGRGKGGGKSSPRGPAQGQGGRPPGAGPPAKTDGQPTTPKSGGAGQGGGSAKDGGGSNGPTSSPAPASKAPPPPVGPVSGGRTRGTSQE